ncbi:MAG TPA: RNA polymerase sigma factor [Gemmatimonadales bacterium]|nr:RNA polymerase sigma factor [Gemmatimonadales bacterium]
MSQSQELENQVADLVPRAQAGDRDAHEELLRRCHPVVYRWCLVHLGDPDDAADVAQEVLVRVYERLERFAGRSRFTTWLYQVTRNEAFSLRRRLGARLRMTHGLAQEALPAPEAPKAEANLDRASLAAAARNELRNLPPRQREVFALADLDDVPPSEIALRLGMNPITVRAHLFRARRTIRTRLLALYPELVEEGGYRA